MKKIPGIVLTLAFVFAPQVFAHADDNTTTSTLIDADARADIQVNAERPQLIRDAIRRSAPNPGIDSDSQTKVRMRTDLQSDTAKDRSQEETNRDRVQTWAHINSTTTAEMREGREEQREEVRERQEERREKLETQLKERFETILKRLSARFNAAIDRLEDMASRIESRIEKLAERGVDTTIAEELLLEAEIHISEAAEAVLSVELGIEAALEAENPREALQEVRELFVAARDAIREAHRALVAVIVELKQGLLELEVDANAAVDATDENDADEEEDDSDNE